MVIRRASLHGNILTRFRIDKKTGEDTTLKFPPRSTSPMDTVPLLRWHGSKVPRISSTYFSYFLIIRDDRLDTRSWYESSSHFYVLFELSWRSKRAGSRQSRFYDDPQLQWERHRRINGPVGKLETKTTSIKSTPHLNVPSQKWKWRNIKSRRT